MSQRDFAKKVGMTDAAISAVILGKRHAHISRCETWCRVLELTTSEAERLTLAMHLAAASPIVRSHVETLEKKCRRMGRAN